MHALRPHVLVCVVINKLSSVVRLHRVSTCFQCCSWTRVVGRSLFAQVHDDPSKSGASRSNMEQHGASASKCLEPSGPHRKLDCQEPVASGLLRWIPAAIVAGSAHLECLQCLWEGGGRSEFALSRPSESTLSGRSDGLLEATDLMIIWLFASMRGILTRLH